MKKTLALFLTLLASETEASLKPAFCACKSEYKLGVAPGFSTGPRT